MADSMRAVVITEFGGPEVLEVQEVERPVPGPKEILVRVRSSGLNRADLVQRVGNYPAPPDSPQDIPGLEYSGTVEAVGPDVTLWKEGDSVMGIVGGGGYAEFAVVHERTAVRVPAGIDLADAGAIPEVYMTAFDAVFRILDLVGGAFPEGDRRGMAEGARQIVVGVPSGTKGQIDLRVLMGKRAIIKGTVLRARPLEEKITLARDFEHRVCPLFAARKVRPIVDSTFQPEDVSDAHTVMAENRNFGKILLLWG
jgi:NADPH:quinone reductase-like Zn-dependent oxidoreductase